MPLYEYQCESCSHRFEVIQKFSDPLVESCPRCGAKVKKLISSPAFQFKGSGFYETDYGKKSKPGTEGKTESSGSDSKESTGSSKDSKESKDSKDKSSSDSSTKSSSDSSTKSTDSSSAPTTKPS